MIIVRTARTLDAKLLARLCLAAGIVLAALLVTPLVTHAAPLLVTPLVTYAAPTAYTCTWTGAGGAAWDTPGSWNNCGGGIPDQGVGTTAAAGYPAAAMPSRSLGRPLIR